MTEDDGTRRRARMSITTRGEEPLASSAPGRKVAVAFTDTLMAWDNNMECHLPAGEGKRTYYFEVPEAWVAAGDPVLQKWVLDVAQQMYADFNAKLSAAEPNDINYLAVLGTSARLLTDEEVAAAPWRQARIPSVWESTPCIVATGGGYAKVAPNDF